MPVKRVLSMLAVVVVASVLVSGMALSLDPEFIDYDSNPVLDPAFRAYYPDVLYSETGFDGHGANSPYKMWFDSGPGIWLAYSSNGISWSIVGTSPVLPSVRHPQVQYRADAFGDAVGDLIQASFPETYAVTPYYKMWVWNTSAPSAIDFAYSDDGIAWHTNYPRRVITNDKLWGSSVIYDLEVLYRGGTYYGYADNNGHMYSTTSSDGTTWSVGTEILFPSPGEWDSVNYSRAAVVRVSATEWHMWFGGTSHSSGGGNKGIGHATSSDGLSWTKDSPNQPVQELGGYGVFGGLGDSGTWNEERNYAMSVIYDASRFDGNGEASLFKMWRSGVSTPTNDYTIGYTGTDALVEPEPPGPTTFHPIAGDDRFGTGVEASEEAFPGGSQTVIIATGRNWPDALGGSALAGAEMCPILLVDTNSIPDAVAAEITRLRATRAIILGGTAAVGGSVATELGGMGLSVTRLGGSDRYATAGLIADAVVDKLGGAYDGTAFAATGTNFPDALAASPLAYAQGWPIYLVSPSAGAPLAEMTANGVTDVLILGGPAAVSGTTGAAVTTSFAGGSVIRLQGDDRYETAVEVATYGVGTAGMDWDWLAIATGENFPDALAGGVVPARRGSVMMLTRTATLPDVVGQTLLANQDDIANVYYLGGTAAVSAAVRTEVAAQLH